jgi:hypothetical protein
MKKFTRLFLSGLAGFLFCIENSYAVVVNDGGDSDAPGYTTATRHTPAWQQLGSRRLSDYGRFYCGGV